MSAYSAPRQAPSRALPFLAFAGLAFWAALTVLVGAGRIANAVRDVSLVTGPVAYSLQPEPPTWHSSVGVGVGVFVFWLLSLNVVLVACVLGVVDIAVSYRSWRRCVAFAAVAVAGPVGALVVSQIGTGDGGLPGSSYIAAIVPGLSMVVVALAVLLAAWRLLGVGRRSLRDAS